MWDFERFSESIALRDDGGGVLRYSELRNFSIELREFVPARSVVFHFCSNTIGSVAGYVAFIENKVIPVMLKEDLDTGLRERLLTAYRPQFLYFPARLREEFKNANVIFEGHGYILAALKNPCVEVNPELALLLTTSGSTGSPKLVRQSYLNIESNTKAIVEYLGITQDEKAITTLPMNYTYGLSIINTHLMAGAMVCLTEFSIMRGEFWTFFGECGATSFGGVPYTYEILRKMRFAQKDLPSLRYMTQAGGKLNSELHKFFAEYAVSMKKRFIVMYGQTEATARMTYLPPEKAFEKQGSIGIAIPGGKLWLRDADGKKIDSPDVVGELMYEGDNVTLGYAECYKDLALGYERNGILETGDMAKFDGDGYFYIVGRLKRFLKIYGTRVNLDEVESIVKMEFPNLEVACGGSDDHLKIYAVTGDDNFKMQIRKTVFEKTGIQLAATEVCSVACIPRNEVGKVLYSKL